MCPRFVVCVWLLIGSAWADENDIVEKAQAAYVGGEFVQAFESLSHVPGLLAVIPRLDRPQHGKRAEIFFDLGRIQIASGDTAGARLALVEAFNFDPGVNKGIMTIGRDRAFEETRALLLGMRRLHRTQELQKTTFWGAAGRSLLFPGWGQIYRGRKKRGYGFMSTTAALAAIWFVADRSYRSANNGYQNTRLDDLILTERTATGGNSDQFTDKFKRAESRASRANLALGVLAAVWVSGVFDHLVVGPAHVSFSVPIR